MSKDPVERKTKASAAPKCRTCKVSEFRHLCRGPLDIKEITARAATAGTRKPRRK